jgi:hypothetical protein
MLLIDIKKTEKHFIGEITIYLEVCCFEGEKSEGEKAWGKGK